MLKKIYGPLPYGEPLPVSRYEPGEELKLRVNETQQRTLVERVCLDHTYKKPKPEFRYYPPNSQKPLDESLITGSQWPVEGPRPYFRKGKKYTVIIAQGNSPVEIEVMVQQSLDDKAEVYFVVHDFLSGYILYSLPKTSLQKLVEQDSQRPTGLVVGSHEVHATISRQHRRR